MQILLVVGSVFIGLAALIHVYIFYLESIVWSKPGTWKTFGLTTQAQADTMKPMAYNQGFYNLFLAIGVIVGLVLIATGTAVPAGYALALSASISMVLAALVLVTSNPKAARSAAVQGAAPLVGAALIIVSLVA
jgi:putative membrane protein